MEIYKIAKGMIGSNTYLLISNDEGIIIDPGSLLEETEKILKDKNIKIKYIILTHAHIDHILYLNEYRKKYSKAKVITNKLESEALTSPNTNGAKLFGREDFYDKADQTVKEGDLIEIGDSVLEIIHTPGHSSGSISIYSKEENCIFTGDTLFREQIGRYDFPRGDFESIRKSLQKLLKYPKDTKVYPGHGIDSTIGHERENNPYIY